MSKVYFYKDRGCAIEFSEKDDYKWSVYVTFPNGYTENIGINFPDFGAAYLAAIQCVNLGLISHSL